MAMIQYDANGHELPNPAPTILTASLTVGVTTPGTISATTNAGASATIDYNMGGVVNVPPVGIATDRAGMFRLNPVTGGGAQAAGIVATVKFAVPYQKTPNAVFVTLWDEAATGTIIPASAISISVAGFSINVSSALTTAHNYAIGYSVVAAA